MKDKLTCWLPQIRCSEKTKRCFEEMSIKTKRTITSMLQIITEDIANSYEEKEKLLIKSKNSL